MAQEREKRRIVIASILKPVDDTRMLDKMGVSLASTGDWDVSIIAYQSTVITSNRGIQLIPLRKFRRLSFGRWLARWKVLLEAWKCKPTLFIFNTHELLIPALVLKVTRNSMIIYDVRENFYLNIRHSESLPPLFRFPLALLVRFKEKLKALNFGLIRKTDRTGCRHRTVGLTPLSADGGPGGPGQSHE